MALNPFLALTQANPGKDPAGFADLVEAAGDALQSVNEDPTRLHEIRVLLNDPELPPIVAEPYGLARLRSVILRLLGRVIDAYLSNHPGGAGEHEFQGLMASVASRANALPVLRALGMGGVRRKMLQARLLLHDQALQRVLDWSRANGLVALRPDGDESHYFLTRRGELVVRGLDQPPWLHVASKLVREAVSLRTSQRSVASLAGGGFERIARITGLTVEAVQTSLDTLWLALDPARTSPLANALSVVAGTERGVLLFPPMPDEDRLFGPDASRAYFRSDPQVVLMLALHRAGVLDMECRELSLRHFSTRRDGADELELPLDRPVVSLSLWSAVTQGLSTAFGSPLQAHDHYVTVRGRARTSAGLEQHMVSDAGVVVRLFDADRGVTHVIVGGRGYRGRLAASTCFAERFQDLLAERPEQSFAVLMQPDPTVEPVRLLELDVQPPSALVQKLTWRTPRALVPVSTPSAPGAVELPDRREIARRQDEPELRPRPAMAGATS